MCPNNYIFKGFPYRVKTLTKNVASMFVVSGDGSPGSGNSVHTVVLFIVSLYRLLRKVCTPCPDSGLPAPLTSVPDLPQ